MGACLDLHCKSRKINKFENPTFLVRENYLVPYLGLKPYKFKLSMQFYSKTDPYKSYKIPKRPPETLNNPKTKIC